MVHTCSVSFHNGISSVFLDWKIAAGRGKSLFLCVWSADLLFVDRLFYEEVFKKSLGKGLKSKLPEYAWADPPVRLHNAHRCPSGSRPMVI